MNALACVVGGLVCGFLGLALVAAALMLRNYVRQRALRRMIKLRRAP